ncbi:MAG TPA: trypsin-like peptidase domain-containing protein [Thermoanaerobaculia bacterium]|nr:trypsin-like peptidase domain-containing protein [Thermoanaerobaculia bacterium]
MKAASVNDDFQLISTRVHVVADSGDALGTGFFYHQLGPKDPAKETQWRMIQNLWLITNRHVALPRREGKELLPVSLTFFLRRTNADGALTWHPITLDRATLLKRLRLHSNPVVDVAAVDVLDLVKAELKARTDLLQFRSVGREFFAGENKISIEVADDVIVIGYPRDFYDQANLYPVVKAGIIATKWGANFNGQPRFLIDAKLFPGSSGSLVVSKPQNFALEDGQFFTSERKHYAFLGVLSSAKLIKPPPVELENLIVQEKLGYDLAEVWYATVVEEIVQSGVTVPVPP